MKGAKPGLKEQNPLMNLPYIVDGDNVISQTNACFAYLGRKCGLFGSNEIEASQCEQLLCELMDLRNKMTGFAYGAPKDAAKLKAFDLLNDVTGKNGIIQKFELWLNREKANGASGNFLVGNKASAPDFHLYEMLDQYNTMATYYGFEKSIFDGFPCLGNFLATFTAHPNNAKYLGSKLASMPFNNKMAVFGAIRNGDEWTSGMEYDWADTSGEY